MRGLALLDQRDQEGIDKGLLCCEEALTLDPDSLAASFGLVMAHYLSLVFQWARDPGASVQAVSEYAAQCARLAPDDAYTHLAQGTARMLEGQVDQATESLRRATERNPSSARAYSFLGQLVGMRGDPDEGIALLEEAVRLSPHDPGLFSMVASIGICHFGAGRLEVLRPDSEEEARRHFRFRHVAETALAALVVSLVPLMVRAFGANGDDAFRYTSILCFVPAAIFPFFSWREVGLRSSLRAEPGRTALTLALNLLMPSLLLVNALARAHRLPVDTRPSRRCW